MKNLLNKKILLIICGGISAYKSLELIRLLKKQNVHVKVILTQNAKKFVTPLSVASLSQEKVYDDLFKTENESEMDHISLSRWADVISGPSNSKYYFKIKHRFFRRSCINCNTGFKQKYFFNSCNECKNVGTPINKKKS